MISQIAVRLLLVLWALMSLMATRDRIAIWVEGERALWADAVRHAPAKPRPWINLGREYALEGAEVLAEDAYRRGMFAAVQAGRTPEEQVFGYGLGAANLALLACAQGDFTGAIAIAEDALTRRPAPTALLEVTGWLQQYQGQRPEAERCSPVSSY